MKVIISPSMPRGGITAPPSKSAAHRLLICAGLSKGRSVIKNLAMSEDIKATLRCLEALGGKTEINGSTAIIDGIENFDKFGDTVLDCGESGSTLRFFIPICLLSGKKITLKGTPKLISRPLGIYKDICEKQGIKMTTDENTVTLDGKLNADIFTLKGNISSQFISGLMFALPLLDKDSIIDIIPPFESKPYVTMTAAALKDAGIEIEYKNENKILIKGSQTYKNGDRTVEGDWSNAAFLYAYKESGADIEIEGVDEKSLQGDRICLEYFRKLKEGRPTLDVADCPDLAPILFAFAAKHNGAKFTGTDRLKLKESDRLYSMQTELKKFGIEMTSGDNEAEVFASPLKKPDEALWSHNDHRVVMACAYLLSFTGGEIENYEAVRKSYPDFFDILKTKGADIEYGS